ncbi:MAG: carbohydrate ABC transporter permease [Lachnospirales bacterium]
MVRKKDIFKYKHLFFIGPHLVLFLVFLALPLVFGVFISFTNWDLTGSPNWVGLNNYGEILFDINSTFHKQFFNGMKNTLVFVLCSVPLFVVIPLTIALALNTGVKGGGIFQSIFYIPCLFSISAVAIIWKLVFNLRLGLINQIFSLDISWLTTQPYGWMSIVMVSIWWNIGGNMIIYRSALGGIDINIYEAAAIDGANAWNLFLRITLPSIKFPLLYTTVITTLNTFNIYGQPLLLTDGGPNESTKVIMMYIRELAFGSGKSISGMASAMAMLLGLVMVLISIFQFRVMNKNNT